MPSSRRGSATTSSRCTRAGRWRSSRRGATRTATSILAARQRHHFLSVHKSGQVAIVETRGNEDCHIILRGGRRPNYGAKSVAAACEVLGKARLPQRLMIDLSHANASKQHQRQREVARDVAGQIAAGNRNIVGAMLESHLVEGRQALQPGRPLRYGQSITDGCLGWEDSVAVLETFADAVRKRRRSRRTRRA